MSIDTSIHHASASDASAAGHIHLLAALAATAGIIHIVAAVEHRDESTALWGFFALVGAAQLWAGWRISGGGAGPRTLSTVALASVVVALLWIFSRTTGLPFGPDAGEVSSVGVADTIATAHELTFAALAWRTMSGDRWLRWLSGGVGLRLSFAYLSLTLFMAALGGHEH